MSVSNSKGEAAGDPLEIMPAGAGGIQGQTPAPRVEQPAPGRAKPPKPYRALVGPVEMLGENWVREMTAWKRRVIRTRSLSKLSIQVAMELAMSVDRTPGARRRGFAVRSHGWLASHLGGNRANVHKAIGALLNLGFIEAESDVPRGVTVPYRLTFPRMKWDDHNDDLPPF